MAQQRFKRGVRRLLDWLGQQIDAWLQWISDRRGRALPPGIAAYRGFGNGAYAEFGGRVLRRRRIRQAVHTARWWENLHASYARFRAKQIPGVEVVATLGEQVARSQTDRAGCFRFRFALDHPLPEDTPWVGARVEVPGGQAGIEGVIEATTECRLLTVGSRVGIISDIDDTVLQSWVFDRLRLLRMTLLHNASTRLPFPGVAELYQGLVAGASGEEDNPVFYVSSSPWNLYDLLVRFFEIHGLPKGPLLLKDFGREERRMPSGSHDHKREKIEHLLGVYPNLPFVLIGDAGQQDAPIYADIVARHSGRIRAIYIRDLGVMFREHVTRVIEDHRQHGVDMVLVRDSGEAAEHALQKGLITPRAARRVVRAVGTPGVPQPLTVM